MAVREGRGHAPVRSVTPSPPPPRPFFCAPPAPVAAVRGRSRDCLRGRAAQALPPAAGTPSRATRLPTREAWRPSRRQTGGGGKARRYGSTQVGGGLGGRAAGLPGCPKGTRWASRYGTVETEAGAVGGPARPIGPHAMAPRVVNANPGLPQESRIRIDPDVDTMLSSATHHHAGVVELADTRCSGRRGRKPVWVQIPPPAPLPVLRRTRPTLCSPRFRPGTSESAGTGRQARLRGVWRKPWGFKSPLSHQNPTATRGSGNRRRLPA